VIIMFVNRKNELEMLEERKSSGKAEFLVIYGRRRVGKSELIDSFGKAKRHPASCKGRNKIASAKEFF